MLVDVSVNAHEPPPVYGDFFKRYSRTLGEWLNTISLPGKTIQIHYGSGERIWSKVIRNRHNYHIDLPVCSFFLKSYAKDENHNQPPEVKRLVEDRVLNAKPWFYKLTYEVNYWLKFLKEVDVINHQIDTVFTPHLFLLVSNKNWKNINGADYWIDCKLLSKSDEIENEPGDKADRVVKLAMEIEMDARLPFIQQAELANTINHIDTDFYLTDNLNDEKINKIKDNIQDDSYLAFLADFVKTTKVL